MTRLKELSKETGFKEPDELTKFLFVIHNTDSKVREYLIDKGTQQKHAQSFCKWQGLWRAWLRLRPYQGNY